MSAPFAVKRTVGRAGRAWRWFGLRCSRSADSLGCPGAVVGRIFFFLHRLVSMSVGFVSARIPHNPVGPAFKDGDHLDRLQAVDLEAHLVTYVRLLVQRDRASLASSSSSSSSIAAPSADEVPAAPLAADVGPASNINELLLPWKPQDRCADWDRHTPGTRFFNGR